MILLGLNIDHCATLRQTRYRESGRTAGGNVEPDPVALALRAERAGADGITVHLREDRRHIQERDVWRLRETIATRLNLEMACTPAMTDLALKIEAGLRLPRARKPPGNHDRGRARYRGRGEPRPPGRRDDARRRRCHQPFYRPR